MQDAANNANGPATGFLNLNMLNQATNDGTMQTLQQMANVNPAPQPANAWTCACGATNTGKFCSNCGQPKPGDKKCTSCGWQPAPGETVGKFCPNCGNPL